MKSSVFLAGRIRCFRTHLAIVHHSVLDQHHHYRLLFWLGDRIIVLITRSNSQLGPIGTKRQRRDGRRVLGVELHSFLGVMVPNGNETVRTTGSKRIVSIPPLVSWQGVLGAGTTHMGW